MPAIETTQSLADFSKWEPAGPGDVRSPCPMLNALANHKILPHDGKKLTMSMVQDATGTVGDVDRHRIGNIFDKGASAIPESHATGSINLDQLNAHGVLEHDASISRQDHALGDSLQFNKAIWQTVLNTIGDRKSVDYATAAKIRHMRYTASKYGHRAVGLRDDFDLSALAISYVELSIVFRVLADTGTNEIPVSYFRAFFEEERLPYKEGWRPYYNDVGRPKIEKILFSIVLADLSFWPTLLHAIMLSAWKLIANLLHLSGGSYGKKK